MVGEIYDNYIAPIQESIERLKKAIQALDKRLSNEILRINSLASSSVSDGKTLTALEEWRKTHEEWTDKQIKDLLEGIDKKLDFDEKIEALEDNVDKLLLQRSIEDTEDWESLVKEYGIVERTSVVEKDIKSLKEKIEALKDKIEILEDKSDKRIDWFEFLEDKVKALEIFSKTVGVSFTSFGKRIEALEEKTIGITNENYLKRGIELSGVRNIVKEFLEVIKGGNTPSDLAFKQWLEMLEGNNNAYSL